ncbi:MAG TPA: transporter substrate-binding domain-containing protein [Thermotogota bacterium]|nr:transporter substrate-binding domain-containing protein [Thermotogota bacterium]HPJ89336.1 transporter substrate-binding domain-containing protein [Thermotogota bacterium]HPR97151.1 transporter substrate-binding domain-containing protein [Thermotogota bacterium]
MKKKIYQLCLLFFFISLSLFSSESEKITLLRETSYYPFEYVDDEGNPKGIFYDIWSLWSEKTGIPLEYRSLESFSEILDYAIEGENRVIGLLFYSPEREKIYDFSIPFYEIKTYLYFNKNIFGVKSLSDIRGFDIGVVENDFSHDYLLKNGFIDEIKPYRSTEELIKAAVNNEIDIFITDGPSANYYLEKNNGNALFKRMERELFRNNVYAAVKKGDSHLIQTINQGLSKISKDEIEQIIDSWGGIQQFSEVPWNYIVIGVFFFLVITIIIVLWNIQLQKKVRSSTNQISKQNSELLEKNKNLQKKELELEAVNKKLKNSLVEKAYLAQGMESILTLTSQLSLAAKEDRNNFLDSTLKLLVRIIPSADYGSISLFEGDNWKFISAIGHDIEKLREIHLKTNEHVNIDNTVIVDQIVEQDKQFIMKRHNAIKMEEATKPISSSMLAAIKIGEKKVGSMILDIDKHSDKRFTKDDIRLMNSFSNVASAFLGMQQYMIWQGKFQKELIIAMIQILELHDPYTKGHSENVANLSAALAEKLGHSKEYIQKIYWAGLVHDIGKILIPETLLTKPGRLSDEEMEKLRRHPGLGAKVLASSEELNDIVKAVKHHHERWDGEGYPEKLKGTRIPEESRIIAIVDTFDAITSDRPYRKSLSWEFAISEIKKNAGKQFDPEIAAIFVKFITEEWIVSKG